MPTTHSNAQPAAGRTGRPTADAPLPDLSLYERLIADGLADADAKGTAADHITARRLAIWLWPDTPPPICPRTTSGHPLINRAIHQIAAKASRAGQQHAGERPGCCHGPVGCAPGR
jgi:hypothetical protein